MKNKFYIICLFMAMAIVACRKPKPHTRIGNWTEMIIESESLLRVHFRKGCDTAQVIIYHMHFPPMSGKPPKPDTSVTVFNSRDIDSIYSIVSDIAANPPEPKAACTDFVGDLEIHLLYGDYSHHAPGSYMRAIDYNGVCDWSKLSGKTQQLHGILRKHLFNVAFGE